jgi:hypothetical protein
MPDWLSEHFGLPGVDAAELRRQCALAGLSLPGNVAFKGLVFPTLASLPMGWKWAVCLAQAVHEEVARRVFAYEQILADRRRFEGFE